MWFWSVSWSTNCPVYFSLFLVNQKKICSVSGNFWSGSDFFGPPNFFLVYQNFFLAYQKIRAWPKKIQRLTKNYLRLNKFVFGRPKKWEIDRIIGQPRDWTKPHGRDYYEAFLTNKSTKILFVVYKKFPRYNLVSFSTQKNYFHCGIESFYTNCMRAIIRRGLYLFYLIFHCSLYCRAVSITDNLCTKHGNSFILVLKICGFLSRAVSNQERVIMARVR